MNHCGIIIATFYLCAAMFAAKGQQTISTSLFEDLFTGYQPSLLPRCSQGQNVTVLIDVALRQILELSWTDCRLAWNPASYDNLTSLSVSFNDIWVPDMSIYDSASQGEMFPAFDKYKPTIVHSGIVMYNVPAIVNSVCLVNVRYFPFDTQRCSLKFGSWSQHGGDIDVVNKSEQGDLTSYIKNSEWSVTEMPARRSVHFYQCCPEPYPDVTLYLVIMRRPEFYMLTMIFPCVLTSFVATLVFLLPVESGEKIALGITVLLSLAVFLLLVSESLPPSSNNFPILGQYFAISMTLVSLSLLQSVLVLNVAYRGTNGRRVPRWAQILFIENIGRIVCIRPVYGGATSDLELSVQRQKCIENRGYTADNTAICDNSSFLPGAVLKSNMAVSDKPEVRPHMETIIRLLKKLQECVKNVNEHISDRKKEDEINAEWKCLSDIMDRLFLVTYFLISVATALAHLLQCIVHREQG